MVLQNVPTIRHILLDAALWAPRHVTPRRQIPSTTKVSMPSQRSSTWVDGTFTAPYTCVSQPTNHPSILTKKRITGPRTRPQPPLANNQTILLRHPRRKILLPRGCQQGQRAAYPPQDLTGYPDVRRAEMDRLGAQRGSSVLLAY